MKIRHRIRLHRPTLQQVKRRDQFRRWRKSPDSMFRKNTELDMASEAWATEQYEQMQPLIARSKGIEAEMQNIQLPQYFPEKF